MDNKKLIDEFEREIRVLMKANRENKVYYRKIIKTLLITCAILTGELILTLAYGKEGILMGIEYIKKLCGG
jgi:hypothetical protein